MVVRCFLVACTAPNTQQQCECPRVPCSHSKVTICPILKNKIQNPQGQLCTIEKTVQCHQHAHDDSLQGEP